MKKIIALILALILGVFLVSCGGSGSQGGAPTPDPETPADDPSDDSGKADSLVIKDDSAVIFSADSAFTLVYPTGDVAVSANVAADIIEIVTGLGLKTPKVAADSDKNATKCELIIGESSRYISARAKAKIENAVSGLVAKGNTSALDALIEEIRWMAMIYTAETAEPLIEKCKETLVFLESNHSQSEIDTLRSEILSLKSNLVVNAKKSELQSFLNTMMAASTSDFTDAELNRFNAACTVAKEILSDVDATDAKIDYAIKNLQRAYDREDGGLGVFGWVLLIIGLIGSLTSLIAGICAINDLEDAPWDYIQLVVGIVLTITFIILMIICGTL